MKTPPKVVYEKNSNSVSKKMSEYDEMDSLLEAQPRSLSQNNNHNFNIKYEL